MVEARHEGLQLRGRQLRGHAELCASLSSGRTRRQERGEPVERNKLRSVRLVAPRAAPLSSRHASLGSLSARMRTACSLSEETSRSGPRTGADPLCSSCSRALGLSSRRPPRTQLQFLVAARCTHSCYAPVPFGKPLSCPLGVAVVPPERFLLGEVGWAAAAAAAAAACAAAVTVRRARAYALWDRQGVRIVLASQSRAERGERARNVPQQPLDGRLERVLDGEHEYAALGVPQDAGRELGRVGERAGRERQAEAQVEGRLLGGTSGARASGSARRTCTTRLARE